MSYYRKFGNMLTTKPMDLVTAVSPTQQVIHALYDFKQMVANTNNAAGIVNSTPAITTVKGLAPGTVSSSVNLAYLGTAPLLTNGRGVLIESGAWEQSAYDGSFDFLHYDAVAIKYTIYWIGKINDSNKGANALCGDNGFFNVNTGMCLNCDLSGSNTLLGLQISRNTGVGTGENSLIAGVNGVITPGTDAIYAVEVDTTKAAGLRIRFFRGYTEYNDTASGSLVFGTGLTNLKFGWGIYGAVPSELNAEAAGGIILKGVDNDTTRNLIMRNLSLYYSIAA